MWGIIVFFISGFGDMIWHETLGVESNLDILLSPTHIGLFAGLILSVPARFGRRGRTRKADKAAFARKRCPFSASVPRGASFC